MRIVWAHVLSVEETPTGLQSLICLHADGTERPASNYPILTGSVSVGERVAVNATALDLGLGTGGQDFVIARDVPDDVPMIDDPAPHGGHIMKLRYTPLQRDVLCLEDPSSPHHDALESATSLEGTPVICCGLHSQVIAVAAAARMRAPQAEIVYVMTDGASLMASLSRVLAAAKEAGSIDTTITVGQAIGGDYEAVNLHSGLLAAKHVAGADIIITGIGPGVVGSDTALGHGGVLQGEAVNAVAALRGTPIAPMRIGFADDRERHVGVSHHTIAALGRIALATALVPVPSGLEESQYERIEAQLLEADIFSFHRRVDVEVPFVDMHGVDLKTMGRGMDVEPAFFRAAFAAGVLAADLALEREADAEAEAASAEDDSAE